MVHNTVRLDWPKKEKKRKLAWLHAQLQKYQQVKFASPAAQDTPWYYRKERSKRKGGNSRRGWMQQQYRKKKRRKGKGEDRRRWTQQRLVHQIARGRKYGVVSHSNKHHGLRPNIRGLPPKEKESYWDNDSLKYHQAYTHSPPLPHEANNDTNDSRHVVSPPEDGVLFDIRRSGAFCS